MSRVYEKFFKIITRKSIYMEILEYTIFFKVSGHRFFNIFEYF